MHAGARHRRVGVRSARRYSSARDGATTAQLLSTRNTGSRAVARPEPRPEERPSYPPRGTRSQAKCPKGAYRAGDSCLSCEGYKNPEYCTDCSPPTECSKHPWDCHTAAVPAQGSSLACTMAHAERTYAAPSAYSCLTQDVQQYCVVVEPTSCAYTLC